MDSPPVQVFLGILLLLSLFLPDSWILGNANYDDDDILYTILTIILVIFSLETITLSIVQEDYFLSFFFWMDTIGTISLILDIGWISNSFLPDNGARSKGSLLRAARAAKLGARYGRLMRLLKLMRFYKFLPCFDSKEDEIAMEPEPTLSAVRKVSAALSSVLSRRVAALVLLIVIIVPFLSYDQVDFSPNAWAKNLRYSALNPNITELGLKSLADNFRDFYHHKDISLMSLYLESPYHPSQRYSYSMPYDVRNDNIYHVEEDYFDDNGSAGVKYRVRVKMNVTPIAQWNAFFGIILIILVIVVLIGFSASFQSSVDELVVIPLEKMMNTLRRSAASLLRGMKAMSREEEDQMNSDQKGDSSGSDIDEELETAVLEKMVEKLARIVKHVTNDNELIVDGNVDSATVSWLNQTYATGNEIKRISTSTTDDDMKNDNGSGGSYPRTMVITGNVNVPLLNSWDFDVLSESTEDLFDAACYMLEVFHSVKEFQIPHPILANFLKELSIRYLKENQYHNFSHAVDVMHTTYRLLILSKLSTVFTNLELYSMLVAAIAHDLGHPGVNNAFLVKTKSDLAMFHNDKSPLENMHCSSLYQLLKRPELNILVNLSESQWRESRKIILFMILGTDMAHHFEQVSKTQLFLEVNGDATKKYCSGQVQYIECFAEEKHRLFIMEILLHCADISNPYKPFQICAKWADLVSQEFFSQGDKERELGIDISPMMDRNSSNLNNMQIGFIEFVVSPLISTVVNIFPPLKEIGETMLTNYLRWGKLREDEIRTAMDGSSPEKKEEELKKMAERMQKFKEKMAFLSNL